MIAGEELALGFEAFVAAAKRLEESHRALQRRADAVDLQLAATNAALQRTLAEREAILRALPVGVLALDDAGRVVWSNPEAGRLEPAARAHGIELAALPAGETERDGLCLAVRRAALPDGGALVVVEDRTAMVRLGREVARLDRLAGLSELALGIAHEIKNPLNGVMGFAALLERAAEPETRRRHVARIVEGLGQVDAIVREMLAFARAPDRDGPPVPLRELVAEAAASAGLPRERLEIAGGGELAVPAGALARVLVNLLRNSVEAGDAVRVRVTGREDGEVVELLLEDDGPGIDAALAPRVFDPFVSTKERGSGLGLALAARVVGFLGGRLELLEGGGGARFLLRLPRPAPGEGTGGDG